MTERERGKMEETMQTWRREPRPGETETPLFNAIWRVVKDWEIKTPTGSWYSATGNDVCGIIDSLARKPQPSGAGEGLEGLAQRIVNELNEKCVLVDEEGKHLGFDPDYGYPLVKQILAAALRHSTPSAPTLDGSPKYTREQIDASAARGTPSAGEVPALDKGEISDGYHTFKELYEHRYALFAVVCADHAIDSWKSMLHEDGTMFEDSFIAGVMTPQGMATYHFPLHWWPKVKAQIVGRAPKWDGHTSKDVPARLMSLIPAEGQVAELRRLREALYACIVELEYVQSVENCNSGLCASAKGKDLIEQGMRLLGVKDLSAEALASSSQATAPAEKEGGE